jgi:hypothetical protein
VNVAGQNAEDKPRLMALMTLKARHLSPHTFRRKLLGRESFGFAGRR